VATLGAADLLCHVTDIGEAFSVELRPVAERHDDVRSGSRLDRRGNARLQVVGVDGFDLERDAGRLLAFLRDLAFEQHVRSRYEIRPAKPVDGGPLRECRRSSGGQDGSEATSLRRDGTGCGNFQKSTSRDASHDFPLSFVVRWDRSVAHLRGSRRRFANQRFHGRSVQPECPRARRQSRIHRFDANRSPIRDGALAQGRWKHALTGSREISAIFKRSSISQVA